MDRFEEIASNMDSLSDSNKKTALSDRRKLCICHKCPSHTQCAKHNREVMYCDTGKSTYCIRAEKSCICARCPVYAAMGLKKGHYCTRGNEKEQRK